MSPSRSTPPPRPPQPAATAETPDSPADLALAEYMLRIDRGEAVDRRAFLAAHPEAVAELAEYFSATTELDRLVGSINLPFGPELAPALEPIRELAARQAALEEEPAEVLLVDSGLNQGQPPVVPAQPARIPPAFEPRTQRTSLWWGAAAAVCLAAGVAMFFPRGDQRPPRTAHDNDDARDNDEGPPRPFVVGDVKWEPPGPVVTLFDEEQGFAQLTPREGLEIVLKQAFAGRKAIRITQPVQCSALPGLPARIREEPLAGEYRYLRFAWKKPGGGPIALVLWGQAPNRKFHYFAGRRIGPADTVRSIGAGDSPKEWTLVERDLFADFGPVNIAALTLITADDEPALFDAIRLAAKPTAQFAPDPGEAPLPRERPKHKQDARKHGGENPKEQKEQSERGLESK